MWVKPVWKPSASSTWRPSSLPRLELGQLEVAQRERLRADPLVWRCCSGRGLYQQTFSK